METSNDFEASRRLEKAYRIANVLADVLADIIEKNPDDDFKFGDVLSALAATTANLLLKADSKEKALKGAKAHDAIICDFIGMTPDALFGNMARLKHEGE